MKSEKSGVTTVCYGKEEYWENRQDALKFFLEAMRNSDGSERERYTLVYVRIIEGLDYCTDSE